MDYVKQNFDTNDVIISRIIEILGDIGDYKAKLATCKDLRPNFGGILKSIEDQNMELKILECKRDYYKEKCANFLNEEQILGKMLESDVKDIKNELKSISIEENDRTTEELNKKIEFLTMHLTQMKPK